jgi:hypothetical protein
MLATLIRTSYAGPTNTRGSRIIVSCEGRKRVVPFNYAAFNAHDSAVATAFGVDAVDVSAWNRAIEPKSGDRIYLAPFDVRMPEPAPDTRPSVTIRRVELDRGGYDKRGGYFGIGAPVYSVVTDDGETYRGTHIRAASYRALADDYRARGYRVTR